eukprot:7372100-Prymnesium_polylepis.1
MAADLKRMFIKHSAFAVSEAFGPAATTEDVCERGVADLLGHVAGGGCSTVFMYGQTGSGK